MVPGRLHRGSTIGLIAPSHIATVDGYADLIKGIEKKGFVVRTADHFYSDTYGYLASEEERAADFNQMAGDDSVDMIFFGGGDGSFELLPYLDFEKMRKNPKIICSYSDGTTILNAVYAKTGLVTYYGQTPGIFGEISDYDDQQFNSHFIRGDAENWVSNSKWLSLNEGAGEGLLVGGYTVNFALLVNSSYFAWDCQKNYILFLEDHEKFSSVACVSMLLSYIEQSPFMERVTGLLFGNYSDVHHPEFMERLRRFGVRHQIPVAYCDDFGHGKNHAILPIGVPVLLDTKRNTMLYV